MKTYYWVWANRGTGPIGWGIHLNLRTWQIGAGITCDDS